MPDFRDVLSGNEIIVLDGAMGSLLQKRGLKPGMSPEYFALENPGVIRDIHSEYIRAGARIITTNTFGGTVHKLEKGIDVAGFNREMALLARQSAGDSAFVAGDVGPCGKMVAPLGDISLREMVQVYKEQIRGLVQGGVDLILAETHFDLAEVKAVAIAAKEVCDLPLIVSCTFEGLTTLTGTSPATLLDTMLNLGVEVIGANCGAGPDGFFPLVGMMLGRGCENLLVQANAGKPELENGRTVFRLGPQEFAEQAVKFADLGVRFIGGCCGTTPEHIRALSDRLNGRKHARFEQEIAPELVLTSRSASTPFGSNHPCVIIGERINPTGKKTLTKELQEGIFNEALSLAAAQEEAGAGVLDVNVGAAMVDEVKTLPELTRALVARTGLPLCLDSTNADALEEALWNYPGSALVNSISGEGDKMERLGPVCRRHGAPFILLPLRGKKLPETAGDRIEIIESLLARAYDLGIPKRLILVDGLVLTVSSKPSAGIECLKTIRHCRKTLQLPTLLGLSNISFGLPARELINSTMLSMSMAAGLSAIIANPGSSRIREALSAGEVLLDRDKKAERFIAAYAGWKEGAGAGQAPAERPATAPGSGAASKRDTLTLKEAVISGLRELIPSLLQERLKKGAKPFDLVNEELIPGITEVGDRYERREYFLPQLLASAETVESAFAILKPMLEEGGVKSEKTAIVMATVEGDVHDIGKNIVCLMLRNHGFEVIDLGKDVPAGVIVDKAREFGAKIIGLSALMTTTMVKMQETIDLIKAEKLDIKVIVGGAVLTEAYAKTIGADAYARDAVAGVRLAKSLSA